ncbi:MAG: hypothetical protein NC419_11550 [Muribaculaceae bacterium]|nr:hypothetical protein [Muribaculaceae bacterium]
MDFNQIPGGLGLAFSADLLSMDRFSNMSDDEKKEYIERHRSSLSERELDKLTASIGQDEDDGPDLGDPMGVFHGPSMG